MQITLNPELENFVRDQARQRGLHDAGEYISYLVEDEKCRQQKPDKTSRGRAAIERMRGTATSGLTTDEIMAMTRSEV